MLKLLLGSWLVFVARLAASASDLSLANEHYDAGKFGEARAAYRELVEGGEWTANLFYNLGNAEFRLERFGSAILAYERALALEPSHPEARANLELARRRTGALPWSESWLDMAFPGRWISAYVIVAAVAGWGAVYLLGAIILIPRGEKSGRWFGFAVAVLVAAYGGAAVWYFEQGRDKAVITAASAEARSAPAAVATSVAVLPAGSEVRVLSVRGDWVYCELPDLRRHWIAARELERVRLGGS